MKTVTVSRDMLVWHDDYSGLYKHPNAGYALLHYATGEVRWMPARQAKNFLALNKSKEG